MKRDILIAALRLFAAILLIVPGCEKIPCILPINDPDPFLVTVTDSAGTPIEAVAITPEREPYYYNYLTDANGEATIYGGLEGEDAFLVKDHHLVGRVVRIKLGGQ